MPPHPLLSLMEKCLSTPTVPYQEQKPRQVIEYIFKKY